MVLGRYLHNQADTEDDTPKRHGQSTTNPISYWGRYKSADQGTDGELQN